MNDAMIFGISVLIGVAAFRLGGWVGVALAGIAAVAVALIAG